MLDFGAGEGHLVRAFRDAGMTAVGVEPSSTARAASSRYQDVELLAGLDDVPPARFTTITLLHVLEHLGDPVETLRALRRTLTMDGHLFIEVPHAGSADMYSSRRRARDARPSSGPAPLHPGDAPAARRARGILRRSDAIVQCALGRSRPRVASSSPRRQPRRDNEFAEDRLTATVGARHVQRYEFRRTPLDAHPHGPTGRKFQLIVRAGA